MGYITVHSIEFDGDMIAIGQMRTITKDINPFQWSDVNKHPKTGEMFVVKNIIQPDWEGVTAASLFVCCEFARDIGGHRCTADRAGHPPWEEQYLTQQGRGDYMHIAVLVENTTATELSDPTWEL